MPRTDAFATILLLLCFIIISARSAGAQQFRAFGLNSGMTPEQVKAAVPGYELRWMNGSPAAAFLVRNPESGNPETYASLGFCQNRLTAVIREIDPDIDFVRYLSDWLRDFGQPKVSIRAQPWTGPRGGDISSVDFTWVSKGVKYMLSLTPEERTGSGELRHYRGASAVV